MISYDDAGSKFGSLKSWLVILICLGLLVPATIPSLAYTWTEPEDVPIWVSGDMWKYWTVSTADVVTTSTSPGIYSLVMTQNYISDNSTYTAGSSIVKTEGYDTYTQTVSGTADISGTYQYIDLLGLGLDESGCFSGTSSNNGQMYRRVSDIAFVKATLTITESVTFYVDCTQTVSSLLGTVNGNGNSEAISSPPINDLIFPMTTGSEWDTMSTVSTTVTPQGGNPSQSTTTYDFHNKVNGTKSHTVGAGTFETFEIWESGTKTVDSTVTNLDQSVYYGPTVKNIINKTQEGEMLVSNAVNFYPDLNITDNNISFEPVVPTQGMPAVVNATIWNQGQEDATNFKAELWAGIEKVDTKDVSSVPTGGSVNVSFDWTPSKIGTNAMKVIVDSATAITEYDEGNNIAQVSVEVSEPRPDLKIEASDIDLPNEVPIETMVTIKATVHNSGNKEATDVLVRFFDGSDQVGGDQTYDTIGQGGSIEASTVWTSSGLGGHTIRVVADPNEAISELSESNNEAGVAVNVIQLNYSFSMSLTTFSTEIGPNETADFQIDIKNTGKNTDTVNIIVSPPIGSWTTSTDKNSVTLTSGSSQPVIVSVHSPLNAPAGDKLNTTVQGTSEGDGSFKQTLFINTNVKQVPGVAPSLKTDGADMSGLPGSVVPYRVEIKNTGNADDTVSLSVDTQKGWTTTLKGPSSVGPIAAGGSMVVDIETAIPKNTLAGDTEAVTITASSDFDPSYEVKNTVVVTCLQVYDLSIGATPPTTDVVPGETAAFTLKLTNDGNGPEVVNLTLLSSPTIPQDWVVTLDPSVNVKADKVKEVTLYIDIPDDALAQEYRLSIKSSSGDGEEGTTALTLNLLQVLDVDVDVLPSSATVKAGKTMTYTVTVTNKGNGQDTIELDIVGLDPKLLATFSESEVTLDPDGSQDVILTIKAKSNAKGTSNFDVKASSTLGDAMDTSTTSISVKMLQQSDDISMYIILGVVIAAVAGIMAGFMIKRMRG